MGRVCVFDTEANGLLDSVTRLWCAVFKDRETKEIFKFHVGLPGWENELFKFMDSCFELCGHNCIQYDFPMLEKLYGYQYKGKKTDTLLISRLHNPNRQLPPHCPRFQDTKDGRKKVGPHSVMAWGYRVGRGKVEHEDWSEYSDAMLHRCTEDTEIQSLIWDALIREASGYDWSKAYPLTFKLFEILGKQEDYGWLMDQPHMNRTICLLTRQMEIIQEKLQKELPLVLDIEEGRSNGEYGYVSKPFKKNGQYTKRIEEWILASGMDIHKRPVRGPFSRISFRKVNVNSNTEMKDFLLSQGWEPKEWNTDAYGNNTSPRLSKDESFKGIKSRSGRLCAKRFQCSHRRSQIQGWIDRLRPDGRLSGVVTGLATTGRAKHANIVNVPGTEAFFGRQMRKCFICKPGFKIVGTDSAGCQNRMLAARVGDEFFTRTLLEGKKEDKTSIHFISLRAIKEEFTNNGIDIDPTYHDCKTANYASLFGASDGKVGKVWARGPDVGALAKKAIFGVAPGFQKLVDDLKAEWEKNATFKRNKFGHISKANGWVSGLDGRPVFIESPHAILVYMLQSDEAIMMSAAYCFLYKWAEARGWKHGRDWGYLVWMHDEYQCEVREDLVEEFIPLAEKAIKVAGEFYNIKCEHKGEADVGINWCETH